MPLIRRDAELTDGVVLLRAPHMSDAPGMHEAIRESLSDLKPWMGWSHDGYSIEETRNWIEPLAANWEQGSDFAFLITDAGNNTILGGTGLNEVNKLYRSANLGYWVRSGSRGQGIAARSARLVARFGFEKLRFVRVEIVVAAGNQASLRVVEKLGAKREGVLRNRIIVGEKIYDAVMHSLVPEDFGLISM
jgi:ribosomal-protein-serine acetyltransferase